MFQGIGGRTTKEVTAMAPFVWEIGIVAQPERKYSNVDWWDSLCSLSEYIPAVVDLQGRARRIYPKRRPREVLLNRQLIFAVPSLHGVSQSLCCSQTRFIHGQIVFKEVLREIVLNVQILIWANLFFLPVIALS